MGIYKRLRTNPEHEINGVWIDYGEFQIRIARAGGANKNYIKCLEQISRPYRRAIQTGMLQIEKSEEITRLVLARSVVLDWKGVTDEDDKPLEFNEDNVLKVLKDIPDLTNEIAAMAGNPDIFREHSQEDDAKNS